MPVVSIDGRPVGNGAPGLIATGLRRGYHRHAEISDNLGCACAVSTGRTVAEKTENPFFFRLAISRKLCLRPKSTCNLIVAPRASHRFARGKAAHAFDAHAKDSGNEGLAR